ncbi:MAG: hypothetical protein RL646_1482 [Verrucomicrobiota bacterium]|jgi:DNA-binding CsgD family transcriptional regulator
MTGPAPPAMSRKTPSNFSMKIDLDPSTFTSKDAYVRAALSKARDLAVRSWEDEHTERRSLIEREVSSLSKQELARRLIKILSRPNRARAQISDTMRNRAKSMRSKGAPVREIAAELGISIPSVYNITKD